MARQRYYLTRAHEIRIAYLAGAGCTLEEIIDDVEIPDRGLIITFLNQTSTELRAGVAGRRTVPVQISADACKAYKKAAVKRDIVGADKVRKMAQRAMEAIGSDLNLLDSVLNDGIKTDA